ncbi:MAG: ComF family protein [Dysgonamonadaceae bacterium]|jgi:ComF family protein|nr:ComF family protein [Dysgonamonadaceae bacterium]
MNILLKEISHLFFPKTCVACGEKLLPSEEGICLSCLLKLPKTDNFKEPGNRAEILLAGRFPFERAASFCVFTSEGMLQPIIHQLKYNSRKELGVALGRLYGNDLIGSDFLKPIDALVPVPLHPKKEKKRGYNQSEMIARGISEVTGLPVSSTSLIRRISNPTQTKKSKNQRWENVDGIFALKNPPDFASKHVLLIDDIITTGSTLEACANALLECPDIRISIATIGEVL